MYDLIYNYISTYLFNGTTLTASTTIMGQTFTLNEWLSHSVTIFAIGLIILVLITFVKWIFRVVGGLLLIK